MYIVNGQQLKKYQGANLILDGASFDIHTGEKVGLIGTATEAVKPPYYA